VVFWLQLFIAFVIEIHGMQHLLYFLTHTLTMNSRGMSVVLLNYQIFTYLLYRRNVVLTTYQFSAGSLAPTITFGEFISERLFPRKKLYDSFYV